MSMKTRILLSIALLVTLLLIGTWYFLTQRISNDGIQVSVSTDEQEYHVGDTVRIHIQNLGDHSVDIYCPGWCALGNFPTTVERSENGQWLYFAGFCPSIEPLFERGINEGNYIRHILSARSSFEVEISNLESLHLEQDERLRIVYYLGAGKKPIYSNEFVVKR
jgi:siroheme synthase (precorrin-2 oxidase/ferrochelatase)